MRIKKNHLEALRNTSARTVLGSSVIRVFQKGTKDQLVNALLRINVDQLNSIKTQNKFQKWFESELSKLARIIKKLNSSNNRIFPGYKWGHSTKVLTLYLRSIVLKQRYFDQEVVERIEALLYVPIDSIVINRIKKLGIKLPFKYIKEIDKKKKFYYVQNLLKEESRKVGVPSVWFDDNWGDRQ